MRQGTTWTGAVGLMAVAWASAGLAAAGTQASSEAMPGEAVPELIVASGVTPGGELRIEVSGGAPREALVLSVDAGCGPVLQGIVLDADGRWERRMNGLELEGDARLELLRRSGPRVAHVIHSRHAERKHPMGGESPLKGSVVITEVMKDPVSVSDSQGEWVEIVNRSPNIVDLEGWTISDLGSNSHTLTNGGLGLPILPNQAFVLAIQDDPTLNGGVIVDYRYSSFSLSNGSDEVILHDSLGGLVDMIAYDDGVLWPDTPGVALNLSVTKMTTLLNDDPASWCDASVPIGPGNSDLGTPGSMNTTCP